MIRRADLRRRQFLALTGASFFAGLSPPSRGHADPLSAPTRGINVPGWFDRADGVPPAGAVLEKLRHAGFETIRLPIDGDVVLSGATALRHVRQGIETLVAAGFSVLADMHPSIALYTLLRTDPVAGGGRVAEAWTALAAVIADLPADRIYPELLNEPPLEPQVWRSLRDRLASIVRAACPDHAIVWGPAPDQGIWQLDEIPPLPKGRQIAAVHFYAPMAFTHQCQSWGGSPLARIRDLPFPATRQTPRIREAIAALRAAGDEEAARLVMEQTATDWTEAAVRAQFRQAAEWSAATGCPVMLNEFGVLDFCVDVASRLAWTRAVRRAAAENGIGWAYWELDQGFGLIENRASTEGFDAAMLDALFGVGG